MIVFSVPGVPATAGSKRSLPIRNGNGRHIVVDANKRTKPWQAAVAEAARQAFRRDVLRGPLALSVVFTFTRPGCHFGTGKNFGKLRASAPKHYTKTPDLSKLVRAIEDAINEVIWHDDRQVVRIDAAKEWGEQAGCVICIEELWGDVGGATAGVSERPGMSGADRKVDASVGV